MTPEISRGVSPVLIGALAPLSRPGWPQAGRHLLTGLELAVEEVNDAGGIDTRPVELIVRDTAGDPQRAEAAVEEFAGLGAVAVAGEFHSVVARAAAARADALHLPFLCSSAVLDTLTDHPTRYVARLAPPQSRGWRFYADFLLSEGHRRIAVAMEPSLYWSSGAQILGEHFAANAGLVAEIDGRATPPQAACDTLAETGATAVLLLTGFPDPGVPLVQSIRADSRTSNMLIGAPAGQPEFADWEGMLGVHGTAIPFLRYRPEQLGPRGTRVEASLRARLGDPPSFVALEGYDTVIVLAEMLRTQGANGPRMAAAWSDVYIDGTRGPITFAPYRDTNIWQSVGTPIEVVNRDPAQPERLRIRYSG